MRTDKLQPVDEKAPTPVADNPSRMPACAVDPEQKRSVCRMKRGAACLRDFSSNDNNECRASPHRAASPHVLSRSAGARRPSDRAMNPNHQDVRRGIALSVGASALFALLSAYATLLAPLTGLDIFAWRIIWTAPGALLLVAVRKRLPILRQLLCRMMTEPKLGAVMIVSAALLGVQQWLFLWAPLHGRMLEVSLGYFLLPLVMVLVGRFYYHERLDALQWLAVACATAGVGHELWATGAFSWPTLIVALGYPPYFVLRRRINQDSLAMFTVEVTLLVPVAIAFVVSGGSLQAVAGRAAMWGLLLPGLGALSTLALASYLKASRLLPLALFGILGYVEPVLLVFVSITLLRETLTATQLATYVPIWFSVALAALHSVRLIRFAPD